MDESKGIASTIGDVLALRAAANPDVPAIIHPRLGTISFGTLARRIEALGSQLRGAGIGPTSRVGIALPRGPEAAMLSLAICCTSILLPLNPNLASADLQEELKRIRLDALIVPGSEIPDWVRTSIGEFGLFTATNAGASFEEIGLQQIGSVPRPREATPITPQSWAAIFKTSGTTGGSKRVPVTHENLVEMARKMERWLKLGPADRSTCIMPIYYNAGFKATLLAPLLIGCSVALPEAASPNDIDRWLADLQPTWLTAAPAFLRAVIERLNALPAERRKHSLRFVLSTASYLPESTRTELERVTAVPVVEFYGLCESGMMTAPALPPDRPRAGSAGRSPEGELAIRADDGRFLGPGQTGQIVLHGPSVMPGYLFDDIDGIPSGLENGWLPTGDLGTVDEEGFLTIVGRTKEIINRGGEKISPYEVEKALLQHPAVREAAAFAVPHPRLGENVGAAVVLHPGAETTSAGLIDFIYDRLAPFQMPRQVHIVESMPVGATGKISRPKLSEALAKRVRPVDWPVAPLELQIAEIWHRLLKRTDIGMDDDFFEIGGDSLQATEMLLELEEITRHTITPSEVRAQLPIRQLSEILARSAESRQEIMTLAKAGHGTPLFLCHGDFMGWGFYAFRLVELLKDEGPVYLLHSILDPDKGIETIEQMASRYLPLIKDAAPNGPIRLGGYCHGGLTALQIASELEKAGRTIESVVLIDTFSINARPLMRTLVPLVSFGSRFVPGTFGRKLRRSGLPTLWRLATHILHGDRAIVKRVARTVQTGQSPAWDTSQRTTYYRAMSKFVPPRIGADIVCLVCEEFAAKEEYAAGAWAHLARSVRYENIPGQHNTCITTHVDTLAERFNRMLTAAPSM